MRRRAVLAACGLLAACAAGGAAGSTGGGGGTPLASGSPDASGDFVFATDGAVDAGAFLSSCNPDSPSSCPAPFFCFTTHTSASWWIDLYGKCTLDCTITAPTSAGAGGSDDGAVPDAPDGSTLAYCSSVDGVCGCPVDSNGASAVCTANGEGGAPASGLTPMVCVPAVKPGTQPGGNEGSGGCGGPNCGGGPEAGSFPSEDAAAAGDP